MGTIRETLLEVLAQNRVTCSYSFDRVSEENAALRLTPSAASVGFIFRHVGETLHRFGNFLGKPADIGNTTIGRQDEGQHFDVAASRSLIETGYDMLREVIEATPDSAWLDTVETPFFGPVTRTRMLAHAMFHNASHAGQIALTLSRGR